NRQNDIRLLGSLEPRHFRANGVAANLKTGRQELAFTVGSGAADLIGLSIGNGNRDIWNCPTRWVGGGSNYGCFLCERLEAESYQEQAREKDCSETNLMHISSSKGIVLPPETNSPLVLPYT